MNLTLIATAVAAATAFGTAWQIQGWRFDAAELERVTAMQEITQENERLANSAATSFEKDRTRNETRTRIITVEVDKIIERPVFRNICVDADGLRLLNAQIRRDNTTGQPGSAVPGPSAAD